MNGWQRLWVLLAALWLLGSGVVLWSLRPEPEFIYRIEFEGRLYDIYATHPPDESDVRAALLGDPTAGSRSGVPVLALPPLTLEHDAAGAVTTGRYRRDRYVALFAAWLVPPVTVYLLGWSVAWVRRGFQRPATP